MFTSGAKVASDASSALGAATVMDFTCKKKKKN
jgi:hypothetical protein